MADLDLDQRAITTIRTLAMDAVHAAHSGHPGTPMAMAPAAYCLWHRVLRFDPDDPFWPNRDRFVLSIGHASMLLYGLLHLTEVQAVDAEYERVVSMPLRELFEQQTAAYRDEVLPPAVKARVAVEQASTFGWERYVGAEGHTIGMRTFGASAPLRVPQQKYGSLPSDSWKRPRRRWRASGPRAVDAALAL